MMTDSLLAAVAPPPPPAPPLYGVVTGVVTNVDDPEKLGRVKVRYPWLAAAHESQWARVAVPLAGTECGAWMLPAVDDEVLLAFDRGSREDPYVIGSLWSLDAKNLPPPDGVEGGRGVQMLRSRSGHVVRLDDREGKERIEIVDRSGENSIVIDTGGNAVTVTCRGDLTLESTAGRVVVKGAKGVDVSSDGPVKVAGKTIDLN